MSETTTPKLTPHVNIAARDGTLLSAAIHWPTGAPDDGRKYPAILEYHPYRKDDRSVARAFDHDYFARHGFVSVRLDVRGTGSSRGVNTDEYMLVETSDGYDVVEWLAGQPWSNGNVGMFGSSYGGFTSFQVATLRPPHLKAIVPIYATDDRYTDDCHYKGGAFKAYYDTGTYGTMMISINALPPDPEHFGAGWEEEWRRRLEANTPYMLNWLGHQTDGPYWRPSSLRGQYEKITAATFIIGGWQDGYPNPPGRAFANLRCEKKLLIGPWNHSRPDVAIPGPRIHYLNEMRRWFDLWLKGEDDGISKEPPVTFYVQSYDPPDPGRKDTTGEWCSEPDWPPKGATTRILHLGGSDPAGGRALRDERDVSQKTASIAHDPTVGITGGLWSGGLPFGLPGDQRRDEALSLVFTSAPLREPLTIAGNALARLRVSTTAPVTTFVAKLADVALDGASALVARGVLNGTRRNGMSKPEPMMPDEVYDIEIAIDATAWRFERGHRVRLAISCSDYPNSWPTPQPATITVHTGGDATSALELPVIPTKGSLKSPQFLEPPVKPSSGAVPEPDVWRYDEDPLKQTVALHVHRGGRSPVREGVWFDGGDTLILTANRRDPADVTALGTSTSKLEHRGATFDSVARQEIRSDATHFHWRVDLRVDRDGKRCFERTWEKSFERELL